MPKWVAHQNQLVPKNYQIINDLVCALCHVASETPIHALWSCSELDTVWSDAALWNFCRQEQLISGHKRIVVTLNNEKNAELFAITVWSIWTLRNQVRLFQPALVPFISYLRWRKIDVRSS